MALHKALGTDMAALARALQAHGRGRDTVLAHITPHEAALLKARGGRGSRNPITGLLEFDDFSLPTENINVTAPAAPSPNIDVAAPAPQKQSQAAAPVENVTSTANAAPSSVTLPTNFSAPTPTQLTAPTVAAPAQAQAPAAAPEQVTAQAPQINQPQIFGDFSAPAIPQAQPTSNTTTSQDVKSFLGNNSTLLSILGLGGLGYLGAKNASASGQQAGALQQNLSNIAQPLQDQANQQLNTTLQGGLTPQNMQVLQATMSQLGQAQAAGAVSSQQVAESISNTFANLLNNQLTQALNLLNTADNYLQSAYTQGYNANVANQTNTTNFYTNLANLASRLAGGGGTTINLGGS